MKIDDKIEPLVREALDASVKEDTERLDAALKAFPSEDARRKGLELTVAIAFGVLVDSHDGKPSPEQLRHVAQTVAQMEHWAGVTQDEAHAYLSALVKSESLAALDSETTVLLTFVITASLLSSSRKLKQDEWWFNYLDRIEAQLEATP